VSRLSRQCGILNIYRPPRPVTGIALLFITYLRSNVITCYICWVCHLLLPHPCRFNCFGCGLISLRFRMIDSLLAFDVNTTGHRNNLVLRKTWSFYLVNFRNRKRYAKPLTLSSSLRMQVLPVAAPNSILLPLYKYRVTMTRCQKFQIMHFFSLNAASYCCQNAFPTVFKRCQLQPWKISYIASTFILTTHVISSCKSFNQGFIMVAANRNEVFYLFSSISVVKTGLGPCGPSSGEHYRFLKASYCL
jgi:hypothetical protein